jgi:hypothetical protein
LRGACNTIAHFEAGLLHFFECTPTHSVFECGIKVRKDSPSRHSVASLNVNEFMDVAVAATNTLDLIVIALHANLLRTYNVRPLTHPAL